MKKESNKFKVKSRDKQSKTTGVRHSDDDVKKAVVDRIFKIEQLNNIPERYVANHSNCSRSSIGRMCKCKFDGQSPIPDWTTIHNYSACRKDSRTIPRIRQQLPDYAGNCQQPRRNDRRSRIKRPFH